MAFDTFDEGIVPGGIRSKNEIKILICYLFNSVNEGLSKNLVIQAVQKQGLANYFETSAAFDDLINNNNLQESGSNEKEKTYRCKYCETLKEDAYACATKLLSQKKIERENSAEIEKIENGYNVICKISGGNYELFSFTLYAPSVEQAIMIKNNFYESPSIIYKVMLALLTKDKDNVGEALEELYSIL